MHATVARRMFATATTPSRWWSASHALWGELFERQPRLSPTPLESDVEVSKFDRMVPPSIDTQLIDGVAFLDDQGDDGPEGRSLYCSTSTAGCLRDGSSGQI